VSTVGAPGNGTATQFASLTSADLLLSLRAPVGWDIDILDELKFRMLGPLDAPSDYRPTVSFQLGEPESPGRDWFDAFGPAAQAQLRETRTSFELVRTETYTLSSLAPVYAIWYRWHSPEGYAFSQVQAFIWGGSSRMYVVNGATLQHLEARDFATYDAMLHSIRLLPPRT
jgi:hypothetical protein